MRVQYETNSFINQLAIEEPAILTLNSFESVSISSNDSGRRKKSSIVQDLPPPNLEGIEDHKWQEEDDEVESKIIPRFKRESNSVDPSCMVHNLIKNNNINQ